jgi:hypothetical protein
MGPVGRPQDSTLQQTGDDAMTQVVTPSKQTTDGQINKAVTNYRTMLETHANDFDSTAVQQVLGDPSFAAEQFAIFRKRVEALSGMIIRRVKPDRSRTPQAMLDATNRKQYTDRKVVDAMLRGEGEEVEVVFFKLGRWISDADLEKEYELRGLIPADSYSQTAVNEADPAFADEHPNGTHWKDAQGNWCFSAFGGWDGGRRVSVRRSGSEWRGGWWFAGLRR